MTVEIPEGYLKDAKGHLVPLEMVKPLDKARNDLVLEMVTAAKAQSEALARFKAGCLADIGAFMDLSAEQYGVQIGGKKGNVTLISFDGRFKVERQVGEYLVFDERLQVAKDLIDQCIRRWAENSGGEIRALVEHAFQVDKAGKVSTSRVLGLRRLDITDEVWLKAMAAISDSVQVSGTRTYVRMYERVGDSEHYRPIPLDAAAL